MGPRIVLELVPLADPRPLAVRLRHLLKTALRRDRLRCLSVQGLALDSQQEDGNRDEAPQGPAGKPQIRRRLF
jgi:hypothetical protein